MDGGWLILNVSNCIMCYSFEFGRSGDKRKCLAILFSCNNGLDLFKYTSKWKALCLALYLHKPKRLLCAKKANKPQWITCEFSGSYFKKLNWKFRWKKNNNENERTNKQTNEQTNERMKEVYEFEIWSKSIDFW